MLVFFFVTLCSSAVVCVPRNGSEQSQMARIVGGSHHGRLEIYHNRLWGTVCDDSFDLNDAHAACRMIGFSSAESFYTAGYGIGQIWLDDMACYGHEHSLTDCIHPAWGQHNCGHGEDVGVYCVEARIVGGSNSGRLEIYYNGLWGTVCDDTFDLNDAHVACRMIGFSSAESYYTAGDGSGQIWLDDMACYGHELSLTECAHKSWGQHNCVHGEDVGVYCVDVRFVGESNSGRLEIYHNGLWGTVCDDTFHINDAHVACRMIGFSSAESFHTAGGGSGQIWLDDMECYGHEYSLTTCTHAAWGQHNCGHEEDVGVYCVEARIVGGSHNGRLEIYYNGQWGTVCDDYFDLNDAHVACRMIGFSSAERFYTIGDGDGQIWLDDMDCHGHEFSLTDCTHTLWADHNCDHGEDVGVYCVKARLVGDLRRGRLEVYYGGEWGTVCDDGFDLNDAQVVCTMLGFESAVASYTAGDGDGRIWLDDMACNGNEISMTECEHAEWGVNNCGHVEDVGIECK